MTFHDRGSMTLYNFPNLRMTFLVVGPEVDSFGQYLEKRVDIDVVCPRKKYERLANELRLAREQLVRSNPEALSVELINYRWFKPDVPVEIIAGIVVAQLELPA